MWGSVEKSQIGTLLSTYKVLPVSSSLKTDFRIRIHFKSAVPFFIQVLRLATYRYKVPVSSPLKTEYGSGFRRPSNANPMRIRIRNTAGS
jgi:hypothetical protein